MLPAPEVLQSSNVMVTGDLVSVVTVLLFPDSVELNSTDFSAHAPMAETMSSMKRQSLWMMFVCFILF